MRAFHSPVRLVLIASLWAVPLLHAQDRWGDWLSPRVGQVKLRTEYETSAYFNEDVGGQSTKMHMVEHDLRFRLPVWQDDTHELSANIGVGVTDLDTGAKLPDTCDHFPGELWDLRFGMTYRQLLDNGWIVGGNLTIGSPSDKPFASIEEITVTATGLLRIPDGERNAWIFMLNYSNNREFCRHIPIPGVAYLYNPDEKLRLLLGMPYTSVQYRPIEPVLLEASYMIPRGVHAKIGYSPIKPVTLYAGFDWRNHRWFRHDREDDDDRLFYYEKRVKAGVEWRILENLVLDVGGGFAFHRMFFEAPAYRGRDENRLNLSDGPFLAAQLRLTL